LSQTYTLFSHLCLQLKKTTPKISPSPKYDIPSPFNDVNELRIEDIVDNLIDNNLLMLANRLQSLQPLTSLLFQSNFGFATKNLKQIKIRMKAVESIKKITKVPTFLSRP
jgi:hypothetical protein